VSLPKSFFQTARPSQRAIPSNRPVPVFDRHPELKVAYGVTESWWLRPVMQLLDGRDKYGDEWDDASCGPADKSSSKVWDWRWRSLIVGIA
jgi:hypothetical protein